MLLKELLDRYNREIVPLKKTTASHRNIIKTVGRSLGHVPCGKLTSGMVVDFVRDRLETVKSSTVRKDVNALGHIIKTGIALWGVNMDNPVHKAKDILSVTKALSQPKPRNRRLADGEEDMLLAALSATPDTLAVSILTLDMGRRLKEILNITEDAIQIRDGAPYLRVVDNKTDQPITVRLSKGAYKLLLDKGAVGGRYFNLRADSISQGFARACKRAGLENLRLTDLRHEAYSRLFEQGYSVPEVMAISGHTTPDMLLTVYAQVSNEKLWEKMSVN